MGGGAVNPAQGLTHETPAWDMVWSGVAALLGGPEEGARRHESLSVSELLEAIAAEPSAPRSRRFR